MNDEEDFKITLFANNEVATDGRRKDDFFMNFTTYTQNGELTTDKGNEKGLHCLKSKGYSSKNRAAKR